MAETVEVNYRVTGYDIGKAVALADGSIEVYVSVALHITAPEAGVDHTRKHGRVLHIPADVVEANRWAPGDAEAVVAQLFAGLGEEP